MGRVGGGFFEATSGEVCLGYMEAPDYQHEESNC